MVGTPYQKRSVVEMAPRLGSSIRLARDAMILCALITFEIERIFSAIPR